MRVMWLQRIAKLILEGLKYFRSQELQRYTKILGKVEKKEEERRRKKKKKTTFRDLLRDLKITMEDQRFIVFFAYATIKATR